MFPKLYPLFFLIFFRLCKSSISVSGDRPVLQLLNVTTVWWLRLEVAGTELLSETEVLVTSELVKSHHNAAQCKCCITIILLNGNTKNLCNRHITMETLDNNFLNKLWRYNNKITRKEQKNTNFTFPRILQENMQLKRGLKRSCL